MMKQSYTIACRTLCFNEAGESQDPGLWKALNMLYVDSEKEGDGKRVCLEGTMKGTDKKEGERE